MVFDGVAFVHLMVPSGECFAPLLPMVATKAAANSHANWLVLFQCIVRIGHLSVVLIAKKIQEEILRVLIWVKLRSLPFLAVRSAAFD